MLTYPLLICTWLLKNRVRLTGFLFYFEFDCYCLYSLQKSSSKLNRLKIQLVKLDYSNLIFQTWFFKNNRGLCSDTQNEFCVFLFGPQKYILKPKFSCIYVNHLISTMYRYSNVVFVLAMKIQNYVLRKVGWKYTVIILKEKCEKLLKWYFVTKILLNCCEKNCFNDQEKLLKFEAEITRTIYSNNERSEQFW